jgi:hypothetical protein
MLGVTVFYVDVYVEYLYFVSKIGYSKVVKNMGKTLTFAYCLAYTYMNWFLVAFGCRQETLLLPETIRMPKKGDAQASLRLSIALRLL